MFCFLQHQSAKSWTFFFVLPSNFFAFSFPLDVCDGLYRLTLFVAFGANCFYQGRYRTIPWIEVACKLLRQLSLWLNQIAYIHFTRVHAHVHTHTHRHKHAPPHKGFDFAQALQADLCLVKGHPSPCCFRVRPQSGRTRAATPIFRLTAAISLSVS